MKEMLTNRILTRLPDAEFARLMPQLEPVSLSAGERLAGGGEAARFVYFPESAVLSYHAALRGEKAAEVGMVGMDGVACLSPLLGSRPASHTLDVLISGSALRLWATDFERELRRAEPLRQALLAYAGEYVTQVSQRSACNILHLTGQRLAVWLLMLTERLGSDTVEVTQERIARHLGVRRAAVNLIVGGLQERGVVSYTRGSLRVEDRRALEFIACECYAAMSAQGWGRVPA